MPKDIRVNSTCSFIMKTPNKQDLQQTTLNHFSNIDFKDFMNVYKKCIAKPYSFLVIYVFVHQIILHVYGKIFSKKYKN